MSTDIKAAWSDLHDAKPPGWFVGRPAYNERFHEWEQHAYDPSERAVSWPDEPGSNRRARSRRPGHDDAPPDGMPSGAARANASDQQPDSPEQ